MCIRGLIPWNFAELAKAVHQNFAELAEAVPIASVPINDVSQCMRFPTLWYVRLAKPQINLRICAV